jgi:hypothetical protein
MTACTVSLAGCVLLFLFDNAVTTADDMYLVPASNFVPDAGCLNLGFAWVFSVLVANLRNFQFTIQSEVTLWYSAFLHKLIVTELLKKFPAFCEPCAQE